MIPVMPWACAVPNRVRMEEKFGWSINSDGDKATWERWDYRSL